MARVVRAKNERRRNGKIIEAFRSSSSERASFCANASNRQRANNAQEWIDRWRMRLHGAGAGGRGGGDGGKRFFGRPGGNDEGETKWSIWKQYLIYLEKQPILTKMGTSGILNAIGDVIAQAFFGNALGEENVDWRRTLTFTFLGAFLVGPALHFWYQALGKIVTVGGSYGAAMRLGLDQLVFAPMFLATFLSALFAIEGNSKALPEKLRQDLFPTVVANWKIWVPFQFLNFRFVPMNLQVGAANIIALLWNVYLSWASHRKIDGGEDSEKQTPQKKGIVDEKMKNKKK